MLIFEQSNEGRQASAQAPKPQKFNKGNIPSAFQRQTPPRWPECSELQVVRHFTRLSKLNFSIDTHFYPLGSCTMKYNPRGVHKAASYAGFLQHHPLAPASSSQGTLNALFNLQQYLIEITGMSAVSLTPMAGSQGEFAGVAMIKAYHQGHNENQRTEMIIPDAAHGTNPASAAMCGYTIIEVPTTCDGDIDLNALRRCVGPKTAGIMLTNPSTLGLFMKKIKEVADIVHEAGGLLYYDGANLNAIIGQVRPGDMGFDVMHLNLHKTFATPHGGGGPGSGAVAVNKHLEPFLPLPIVIREAEHYRWANHSDYPKSIGRLSCFMGNVGILLRAYFYIRLLGHEGLTRIAHFATLNANYLQYRLTEAGFQPAYPGRRASHEFTLTLSTLKKEYGVLAMDVAKRLLDYGFHAPTSYFPLIVPECFLIEPTETECKEELDLFVTAMKAILNEAKTDPSLLKDAPHTMPVKRLDDVKAARELNLTYFYSTSCFSKSKA
jgi:glycine dehydrogenase subunit 2